MNKLFVMCIMMLLATSNVSADNKITLKDVTGKTFTPKYITGVDPIKGTDRYASISNDGRQIIEYAFKTGNQTRVLFDIANTPFRAGNLKNSRQVDHNRYLHGHPTAIRLLSSEIIISFS